MKTQIIVESLLDKSKNYDHLKIALKACGVINNKDRSWDALEHSEISKIIEKFETPHIICMVSKIITIFIIEPKKYNRVHPVIQINGNTSRIRNLSKSKILSECLKYSNIKDFLPESMYEQIYWIPYRNKEATIKNSDIFEEVLLNSIKNESNVPKEELDIVVFSELSKNLWTINPDISNINVNKKTKTTKYKILQALLKEI